MIALAIILGILLLLLFTRFGVLAVFTEETVVKLRVGLIKITVYPPKDGKSLFDKKDKKKKDEEEGKEEEKKEKKKPHITKDLILDAIDALGDSLQRGIKKTKRHIRINPCKLAVNFGGSDPCTVAQLYGYANAALWTLMPKLDEDLNIPNPGIHLDCDFTAPKTEVRGRIGISLCLFDVLVILTAFGKPLLKWYKANKDKLFPEEEKPKEEVDNNNIVA